MVLTSVSLNMICIVMWLNCITCGRGRRRGGRRSGALVAADVGVARMRAHLLEQVGLVHAACGHERLEHADGVGLDVVESRAELGEAFLALGDERLEATAAAAAAVALRCSLASELVEGALERLVGRGRVVTQIVDGARRGGRVLLHIQASELLEPLDERIEHAHLIRLVLVHLLDAVALARIPFGRERSPARLQLAHMVRTSLLVTGAHVVRLVAVHRRVGVFMLLLLLLLLLLLEAHFDHVDGERVGGKVASLERGRVHASAHAAHELDVLGGGRVGQALGAHVRLARYDLGQAERQVEGALAQRAAQPLVVAVDDDERRQLGRH